MTITDSFATATASTSAGSSVTLPPNVYVGADNIGKTSATVRFEKLLQTGVSYKVFKNTSKANNLSEAKAGSVVGTGSDVNSITLTGLIDKTVYYISVVAEVVTNVGDNERDDITLLLGSYGFVTGATLYWDATVPKIAGETASKWKNIAVSTIDYDGNIPSSASITKGYYTNESDGNGLSFTALTTIRGVFLDAVIASNKTFILGHSSRYDFHRAVGSPQMLSSRYSSASVRGGQWFTNSTKHTALTQFVMVNRRASYGILTTGNVAANQTRDRTPFTLNGRNWHNGKYYRLIIFTEELTEAQGLAINTFLASS